MRDQGLEEAIRAVGGIGALARTLGISQPSVSNWQKVPAERVRAVESISGVPRAVLRPDLYGDVPVSPVDEVEEARADEYQLLATLLLRAPGAELLAQLARLKGDASPIGMAHLALATAAENTDADTVSREYFDLFIGLGRGELLPYASYYLSGFLHERPLARLREDLARFGIERREGVYEPEDHAGTLFEIMSFFARGTIAASREEQLKFFERHLKPWIGRFLADLAVAQHANFYKAVAALGTAFIEIETEAFGLPD